MDIETTSPNGAPKLLCVTKVFGASGQPWIGRQVSGFNQFQRRIVCWTLSGPNQTSDGVPIEVLPFPPVPYDSGGRWLHRLRCLHNFNFYASLGGERQAIYENLSRNRPDVILCYFGDIAMRLIPTAANLGIPVVAYLHGDFLFNSNRWYRWSMLKTLRKFASVVVVTNKEKTWIRNNFPGYENVQVVPCGAPTEIFQPSPSMRTDKLRFVMASRLCEEKGCHLSIKAFAAIHEKLPGAELHIFGDGPSRQELEAQVRTLNIADKVVFYGYVTEAKLASVLPGFDIFIQHSLVKEGSPVSIAEAMSCALPVVATPVGGIVDQIVPDKTGFLVEQHDVAGMAAAMERLAKSPEMRQSFGLAGRERAENMLDCTRLTKQLQEILLEAVGKRNQGV